MTSAAFGQNVVLTMTVREAEFLRTLTGSLSSADFQMDHPAFNLVRSRYGKDAEYDNQAIARALIDLLGSGLGEEPGSRRCRQCQGSGLTAWDGLHDQTSCLRCGGSGLSGPTV
jgi:DnaJ-class molecular chaperone